MTPVFDFGIAYVAKPVMQPAWLRIDWRGGRSTFLYLQGDGSWNPHPFRGRP